VSAPVEGLLLVDKPDGCTSHDAVARVRRALGTRKVGHAGTLDPMATGLLVMGVGRATRLLRFLGALPKTYDGTFRLGVQTTTLDADGEVTMTSDASAVTLDELRSAMAGKVGASAQRPPAFSAVKVGGRKLYDAARTGETLEGSMRIVRVDRFDLVARRGDDIEFEATVSGGTYVRVLVADVGAALGVGAHLSALRRTRIGAFDVADASPPDDPGPLLPLERSVAHLPRVGVAAEEAVAASHGRILGPAGVEGPYGVYDPAGVLIGIWRDDNGKARPEMVLAPA
jgi:tRNA pseudouridine55 synthase